jgi:4-amino-4-deoxy-L-arabinose transferase-like glycosyltransferase
LTGALRSLLLGLRAAYNWLTPRRYAVLLVVTTAAHVVFTLVFKTHPGIDGAIYQGVARNILAAPDLGACGAFAGAYWPPLFCYYLALFWTLLGRAAWRFFLGNVLIALAAAVVSRRLLATLCGERTGRWAALLFYNSMLVYYFTLYYKYELLVTLLLVASLSLYLRPARPGKRAAFPAGVLMGLATLGTARLIVLVPALLYLDWARRPRRPLRRIPWEPALFLVGIALAVTPWVVRNEICLDRFVPYTTNGGMNFYMGFHEGANGSFRYQHELPPPYDTWDRTDGGALYRAGWEYIRDHPGRAFLLVLRKLWLMWRVHYFDQTFFYPFFWIGIFMLGRLLPPERKPLARAVQFMFLLYAVLHGLYIARFYYVLPLLPLIYGIALSCQRRLGYRLLQRYGEP